MRFDTSKAAILIKGIASGVEMRTPPTTFHWMPYLVRISSMRVCEPGTMAMRMPSLCSSARSLTRTGNSGSMMMSVSILMTKSFPRN